MGYHKALLFCSDNFMQIIYQINFKMAKQRKTGKDAASSASRVLKDGRTGKDSKKAAGSALSQRAPVKRTKKK